MSNLIDKLPESVKIIILVQLLTLAFSILPALALVMLTKTLQVLVVFSIIQLGALFGTLLFVYAIIPLFDMLD